MISFTENSRTSALPTFLSGVELGEVVDQQLLARPAHKTDARAETAAMHILAQLLPDGSPGVFQRLAEMAVEFCDADSSGVSVLENTDDGQQIFRWSALAGELEGYVGRTAPRECSLCGECLNAGRPMLYSYPRRLFTYFQRVDTVIVEGLVIPMVVEGRAIGAIWIVSNSVSRHFDASDVQLMTRLGSFVAGAVQLSTPQVLRSAAPIQEGRDVVWKELIRRIANGDAAALESLMEETRPFVFARTLRILSCPADADEATSDVYSQIWKISGRYDSQRQGVLAWLLNLARSRAIDHLRVRARRTRRLDVAVTIDGGITANPERSAAHDEAANQVRQAMKALSFEQRRALEMAYFDGYSAAEIASRLGHPIGSVKTRMRAGLTSLRLLMSPRAVTVPAAGSTLAVV